MIRDAAWLGLTLALWSPSSAAAHDWYEGLVVPGTRMQCCSAQDCRAVPDCSTPGGLHHGVVIEGRCIEVPESAVLKDTWSPDDQTYACFGNITPITIRCLILPGQSA
jgi:hypothetical protein